MKKKDFLKTVLSISLVSLAIGCSSSNSPVSVSENDVSTSATLVGNSPASWDVVTASPAIIWAKSMDRVPNRSTDYYFYKYNTSNSTWANTGHWGTALTVSPSGKCYHINGSNEVWWGDGNGNYGQISNIPALISLSDITVSNIYSGLDQIWVLGKNSSGNTEVRRCNFNTNDNSYSWDNLNAVYIPQDMDYPNIIKVVRDPCDSRYVALVFETNTGGMRCLYGSTNSGYTYQKQNTQFYSMEDAAVRDGKIVFTAWVSEYLVRGVINGTYDNGVSIMTPKTCAINKNGSSYNVYILDGNYRVDQILY